MSAEADRTASHELGRFLRTRRERHAPVLAAATGGRRRTPGLRREEVAERAGVSVDYVVRLEQGRGLHPSAEILEALAAALGIDDDERSYLFDLAGQREVSRPPAGPAVVAGTTTRLVADLSPLPAMLVDHRFDVLAWNPEMAALLVDFAALPTERRNSLELCLFEPALLVRYVDRELVIREAIADLRAAWAARPEDAVLSGMIERWRRRSTEFAQLWEQRDVRVNGRGRKRMHHPAVGRIDVEFEVLAPLADPHLRLAVYRAADPASQTALDRLRRPDKVPHPV